MLMCSEIGSRGLVVPAATWMGIPGSRDTPGLVKHVLSRQSKLTHYESFYVPAQATQNRKEKTEG